MAGPTTPSAVNPTVFWKLITALVVLLPTRPSIGPGLKPLQFKKVCISIKLSNGATALLTQAMEELGFKL